VTRIWLSGEPRPAPRPRNARNGHSYNPRWYMDMKAGWAQEAALQLIGAPLFMGGERLVVRLDFYRKDFTLADWDNLAKAATDPLNGLLWTDDAQIDEAHVRVRRGVGKARAGVWVSVDVRRRQRAPGLRRTLELGRARRLMRAGRV